VLGIFFCGNESCACKVKYGVQIKRYWKEHVAKPCFLFKMFTHGLGSGVELVRRMTKGDLKTSLVMFDHIKRMHD
jgi:hypothetical protein